MQRKAQNKLMKQAKADMRHRVFVQQGQVVAELEKVMDKDPTTNLTVDKIHDIVFNPKPQPEPSTRRGMWLNGKLAKTSFGGRKGISGHKQEFVDAIPENGSRTFTVEVDKILNPKPEVTPEA